MTTPAPRKDNTKHYRRTIGSLPPAPNLEAELDNFVNFWIPDSPAIKDAKKTAKSQLKQLILKDKLKDFLELIGRYENYITLPRERQLQIDNIKSRNKLRQELRQSARKRYQ